MKINLNIGPKTANESNISGITEKENSIVVHWRGQPGGAHMYTEIQKQTLADWYQRYAGGVTPEPIPGDLGNYLYSVGLLSDLHICKTNGGSSGDWWDEDDFKRAMDLMAADTNIKCIMGCGDIAESQTNDDVGHPNEVSDADYAEFMKVYNEDTPHYWETYGLRFFTCLGNHDYYGLFESRPNDDKIWSDQTGTWENAIYPNKKNSETIGGYNMNVNKRIGNIWPTGQCVNAIPENGRNRIVFELEAGRHTVQGQADMSFFAYNGYVDLYADAAGYTGSSIWDASKGGISDEAIRLTKNYVNNNWDTCKDKLSGWKDENIGLHGRNGYSKLNYWLKKDNDIFIFLSVDYGNDDWGITTGPVSEGGNGYGKWHDRVIHARRIIDVSSSARNNDPYVRRMYDYVQGSGYTTADEPYNYQYYSPNTLIWLKEIIENNPTKKIYVFAHHFLPHKAGNSNGIPKSGAYKYSDVSKNGVLDTRQNTNYAGGSANAGSNALTGIEFWFLNKLNNTYKNVIFFNGHSHISWEVADAHFVNRDYNIVSPSLQNENVYTRDSNTEIATAGYTVSLPSVSKPRYISGGDSVRRYEDAEMTIMEIYEKGVKIKGYKIRKNNTNVQELLAEKDIQLL